MSGPAHTWAPAENEGQPHRMNEEDKVILMFQCTKCQLYCGVVEGDFDRDVPQIDAPCPVADA